MLTIISAEQAQAFIGDRKPNSILKGIFTTKSWYLPDGRTVEFAICNWGGSPRWSLYNYGK